MHCPKCKTYTAPEMLLDVEVDICPSCEGIWFDRSELSRVVGSESDLRITDETVKDTPYKCPRCFQSLVEVPYSWDETLLVDVCARCQGIFLDHGELEKASAAVREFKAKYPEERVTAAGGSPEAAPRPERVTFMKRIYLDLRRMLSRPRR